VTRTPAMTDDERRHFLRYTRTKQWPMLQRFPVEDSLHTGLLAQMLGCTPEHLRTLVGSLRDATRDLAADMTTDPRFLRALAALPFRDGERIVAVGDSITADRIGWFELLMASIDLAGNHEMSMRNLGVSGNTSADVLERFDLLEAAKPTLVLLMVGTNDARSHGRARGHRMATTHETERNLRALIDLITVDLNAAVRLITPPAVDQRRIATFFAELPLRWHANAVAEVADTVRKVDPNCVDIHAAMDAYGLDDLLESDGVHPNLAGQKFILRTVVERLATGDRG
jgi:acyl-CoA thioesterase-1